MEPVFTPPEAVLGERILFVDSIFSPWILSILLYRRDIVKGLSTNKGNYKEDTEKTAITES
ncbi:MAG: hypothetical protein V5A77_01650 [Candidatus Bipolaricaulota bacterium]|nr:hypothetical protein [Candidatus Bipolaricaulota bacterium]MBS3791385.1 hypothetical protein [Candidatus Bipolaricaulota bacterium]